MGQKSKKKKVVLTARTADKLDLYQRSVQSPDVDVPLMERLHRRLVGKPLRTLREDFCGTAQICCEFVSRHRDNHAIGVDLDRPTLDWGRARNVEALKASQQDRVSLIEDNVLNVRKPRADLTCAMNFSYSVFKTRPELLTYMKAARRGLKKNGILLMDLYGGPSAQEEEEETTRKRSFMYIWDQARFDPITHHTLCRIHFAFRDGSRLRNAFTYDWRLWTLPELQELMAEAGFHNIHVLWEGTDSETDEGNGVYRRKARGDADHAWISYVVGQA
jgi:SAM-dependent methyltransferase